MMPAWLVPALLPALAMGVGLAGGLLSWWPTRPRRAAPARTSGPGTPGNQVEPLGPSLEDTEAQLSACLAQLIDLKQQRRRLRADAYAAQVTQYQAQAAQLMRRRDALAQQAVPHPSAKAAPGRPFLRGYLWGAGTVGTAACLLALLQVDQVPRSDATLQPPRQAAAPGPATPEGPALSADAEQEMQALMAALQKNPEDAGKLVRLAHLLLQAQMLREARIINDRAQRFDADNLEAKVHAAVLQAAEGGLSEASQALDALVKAHANLAEAWFFRGMLALQSNDRPRMLDSFRHFVAVAPPGAQRDRIAQMVRSAEK